MRSLSKKHMCTLYDNDIYDDITLLVASHIGLVALPYANRRALQPGLEWSSNLTDYKLVILSSYLSLKPPASSFSFFLVRQIAGGVEINNNRGYVTIF